MKALVRFTAAALTFLALSAPAHAQASRTWVSGVGDDVNPCSRTAPCKTFAGAISKTAAGGVISVLDPGGFGAVTITKSITIDGGGIEGSILGALVNGIVISNTTTDHVTIRNLTIFGVGSGLDGIRVTGSSGSVTVQNVTINGFTDGIDFNAVGQLQVTDSYIHDNSGYGIYFRGSRATLDNVRIADNGIDGVRVGMNGNATIRNSAISGNANLGLSAVDAASAKLTIESCAISNNAWGIGSANGATVWVSNSTISGSTSQGLWSDGASSLLTFGNNRMSNNAVNGVFTGSVAVQ